MQNPPEPQQLMLRKLAHYGCAAGAGVLASSAVAGTPPKSVPIPVDGLPITIDSSVLVDAPLLLDIDGNGEDDFQVYYKVEYGGGFAIQSVEPVSEVGYPRIQYDWQYLENEGTQVATRNDLTEYVPVNNTNYFPSQIYNMYTSATTYLDRNAAAPLPAYTPFRNNPGFLGLMLGDADYSVGHAATLKVSVRGDGTQLTIHSGWFRDDLYDLYLDDGVLHGDGFEAYPESDYFPAVGLTNLAEGDGGAAHE